MNFFEFSRELSKFQGVVYPDAPLSENDVRDFEDAAGGSIGSELELYLRMFGSIRYNSVCFLGSGKIADETKLFEAMRRFSGKYFVIEHKMASVLAMVDQTDKVWLYDEMSHELAPSGQDLFEYIIFRISDFTCDPMSDFVERKALVSEWWEEHRAIKSDIMHLIVRLWTLKRGRSEIMAGVMTYLSENAGYLPCGPRKFLDAYFDDFWPVF